MKLYPTLIEEENAIENVITSLKCEFEKDDKKEKIA